MGVFEKVKKAGIAGELRAKGRMTQSQKEASTMKRACGLYLKDRVGLCRS